MNKTEKRRNISYPNFVLLGALLKYISKGNLIDRAKFVRTNNYLRNMLFRLQNFCLFSLFSY